MVKPSRCSDKRLPATVKNHDISDAEIQHRLPVRFLEMEATSTGRDENSRKLALMPCSNQALFGTTIRWHSLRMAECSDCANDSAN
jgi:hypothetical protein